VTGASGRVFQAGVVGSISVGDLDDAVPPLLEGVSIEATAGCLRARLRSNEPVTVTIVLEAPGFSEELAAGAGISELDFVKRPPRVPAAADIRAVIRAHDVAGNAVEAQPTMLATSTLASPTVVITEVLANPSGSETTQEIVELRNISGAAVSVGGWVLEDAVGADTLEDIELGPGAYALVVSAGYDPASGLDPAPRAGTALVRVPGRLGSDGLGNAGEGVRLKNREGVVISSYGGVAVSAAAWNGKSVRRVPTDDACDVPASWSKEPADPTPGW
jgi:hypothetical protein